jgi:hypothetical protein
MRSFAIVTALILSFAIPPADAPAGAVELVTTCGQQVANGILAADLDCSGGCGDGVKVEKSLSLGGFQLKIGAGRFAVHCVKKDGNEDGHCKIFGPGTIVGAVSGARSHGVQAGALTIEGVSFSGNLNAVVAARVTMSGCDINGVSGSGIWGGLARVSNSQIMNSGRFGIGVAAKAILKSSTVTGSVLDGVTSGDGVVLKDSTVTGNATNPAACQSALASTHCTPDPQPWLCADVTADGKVKLKGASTCDRSLVQAGSCIGAVDYRPGDPVGVCTAD